MTDEDSPKYKDGDIVWVKLGPCWWPAEVTENGPEDFTAKKPPLVIVKFFNESTYEFIKSYNNIYLYNCEKKNEFIKKGMDSFRGNNSHMEKFPGDVSLAEIKTDGNPNILSDPIFAPQKKSNIIAEVFGSPTPKKTPKESRQSRGRSSTSKNSSKKSTKVNITHRRFLGCDDYEAHVRVQYPGKDTEEHSDGEEIARLNAEPSKLLKCSSCNFETTRLEVMLFHVQCHIKGIASPVQVKRKKTTPKKKQKPRIVKHITSEDDRTNSSVYADTDSEEERKPKRKKRSSSGTKKAKQKKTTPEEEKTVTDIRTNLLAEWSDSEDNEEQEPVTTAAEESLKKVDTTTTTIEEPPEKVESKPEGSTSQQKEASKSCFDFDEEEEEDSGIVQTAVGRKIPRVIPPPIEKRKSTDPDNEDASLPIAEDDENRMEILKVSDNLNENSNSVQNEAELAKEELVFKDLMDSTAVPDLPDVPDVKPNTDVKKSPTEVATKLTNPKKRFVKSFEDFELLQNERRAQEERDEELKREKTNVVVEPVEPEPVEKIEEESVEPDEETVTDETNDKKSDVQISKLKCQIMSKLSDEVEPDTESPKVNKDKGKAHRTPRSKILESYRNDKYNEQKQRQSSEEREEVEESKMEVEAEAEVEVEAEPEPEPEEPVMKIKQDEDVVDEEEATKEEESPKSEEVSKEEEMTVPDKSNSDEEIGKIPNQIDEYFNDLLFNFEKKPEEEEPKKEEEKVEEANEVHIKCAENEGDIDISIKTNLTNFSQNDEEMSALSTLAMVSEMETVEKPPTEEKPEEEKPDLKIPFIEKSPVELVPIDGNLTVVSEKDLADGQVEITASVSPPYKKPVTLTNFSMDFSECNSNSTSDSIPEPEEPKPTEEPDEDKKVPGPEEVYDLEEHIPSQIVDKSKPPEDAPTSKLLERLTTDKDISKTPKVPKAKTKFVIKAGTNKLVKVTQPQVPPSKPIILSEKIIKPAKVPDGSPGVSVQKITSKRNLQDADEIDAYVIQKDAKNSEEEMEPEEETPAKKHKKSDGKKHQVSSTSTRKRGKAKILQQTIITPAGEIIQPNTTTTAAATPAASDDNVFDINSMPIVLSDQILTPESIENMPIFLSDAASEPVITTTTTKIQTVVKKPSPPGQMRLLNKSIASPTTPKLVKTPKILGSVSSKLIKQNSFPSSSSKHGKYVIVTQSSPVTSTSKYTVGKKQTIIKRGGELMTSAGTLTKVQNIAPEPSGNKIMILTNQQGQQQRVLLTPAQQKLMGYQTQGTKVTKTLVKGNIIQKSKDGQVAGSSGLLTKTVTPSRLNSNQTLISSSGHVLTPIHPQQSKTVRIEKSISGRKIQMQPQKVQLKQPQQKTILIKNQHGQTVRKIQGTDDALLDQQVAQQIKAIKASGVLQQKQEILNYKSTPKGFRRAYAKKPTPPPPPKIQPAAKPEAVPPLAPISPKKAEPEKEKASDRPLNQLVIQDAMGNQTTITEGQILALPSETIDGQPQSYMLVTLDESGNLTPLDNQALLSLDPNLNLGGDMSNTVLQIDQSALKEEAVTTEEAPKPEVPPQKEEEIEKQEPPQQQEVESLPNAPSETGQQLIVTGDPIAAQKFLESLTEGSTDLATLLASAEGSNILIHADGQQILINTDSDNQMLLSVNTDSLNMAESSEGGGNPIFATQPPKNQDILAAALADTDVFQQEQNSASQGKVLQSQLSPNSTLYPMNVSNVLETSLTLNSPIMTPLEVPSTNSKKIADENDILTQVPKNVDLPITITDPNISQTVSQQQVASMMVNELQNNLELALPISDSAITAASTEMNSPSFVYSLPNLDSSVDINQKPFNSSMPLLTEDGDEANDVKDKELKSGAEEKPDEVVKGETSFLDESEGLCTLGGEMCSSLSEPPPDMFDLSAVLSSHQIKSKDADEAELKIDDKSVSSESANQETASVTETSSPNTVNEDSCEIPVQPEIVTTLKEDGFEDEEEKPDV